MLQPLDGPEPGTEIDLLIGIAPEFIPEKVILSFPVLNLFHNLQLLGLHPEECRGIEEGPAGYLEVELLTALEFREETIGHFDDVDVPGIDLPPFRKADQDLDRILDRVLDG